MSDTESKRPETEATDGESPSIRVEDRRHWARNDGADGADADDDGDASTPSTRPTIIDEYRERAESAESKLQEYIRAYKKFQDEQEQVRVRLRRDIDRRVEASFGEVVGELLEVVDDLDLALGHVGNVPEAKPLADGVSLVRRRFLETLERRGVERVTLDGEPFDPNVAEAVRVDAVDDAARNGVVTETLRPGYRLGDRVLRPARVAVGKHGA